MDIFLLVVQEVQVLNHENVLAKIRKEGLNDTEHDKFKRYSFGLDIFADLEDFLEGLRNSDIFSPGFGTSFEELLKAYHPYDKWFIGEVIYSALDGLTSDLISNEEKLYAFEGDLRTLSRVILNFIKAGFKKNSIYYVAMESFKLLYSLSFVLRYLEKYFGKVLTESIENMVGILRKYDIKSFHFYNASNTLSVILGRILTKKGLPNVEELYFSAISYYILGGKSSKEIFCRNLKKIVSNFEVLLNNISSRSSFKNEKEFYEFIVSIELFPSNYLILGAGLFEFAKLLVEKFKNSEENPKIYLKALGQLYEKVGTLTYEEEQLKKFVNAASRVLCKRP